MDEAERPSHWRRVALVDPEGNRSFLIEIGPEGEDGALVSVSHSQEPQRILAEFEQLVAGLREDPDPQDAEARARLALVTMIDGRVNQGWEASEAPGDVCMEFTIDLAHGTTYAAAGPAHPLATVSERLVADVFKALSETMGFVDGDTLAEADRLVATGDHEAAFDCIQRDGRLDLGVLMGQSGLLDLMLKIDVELLPPAKGVDLRRARMHLTARLGKPGVASEDARWLATNGPQDGRVSATLGLAHGLADLGRLAAARAHYDAVIASADAVADLRGHALVGAASIGETDEERARLLDAASTMFLEAGDRVEAAKQLSKRAAILLYKDPSAAVAGLAEAAAWLPTPDSLQNRYLRGSLANFEACSLLEIGRFDEAVDAARRAISFLTGVLGAEITLLSAMGALVCAHEGAGRHEEATTAIEARRAISSKLGADDEAAADEFVEVLRSGNLDGPALDAIGPRLRPDKQIYLAVIRSADPTSTYEERLERLDVARAALAGRPATQRRDDQALVDAALAELHRSHGKWGLALEAYQRVLEVQPDHEVACQNVAVLLEEQGRWAELRTHAASRRERLGPLPGWLVCEARAARNMGDRERAVSLLSRALTLAKDKDELRKVILVELERADGSGTVPLVRERDGVVTFVEPAPSAPAPLPDRAAIEEVIRKFAEYVASHLRMNFWAGTRKDRGWAPNPEAVGQQLLRAFLGGHLGDRAEILEEVRVGAGRMDVYVLFPGGIRVVIELKICGRPYSLGYAEGGADQLAHYMKQKKTALGFLLIFDGRSRDYGTGLSADLQRDDVLVKVTFIDVRPTVT